MGRHSLKPAIGCFNHLLHRHTHMAFSSSHFLSNSFKRYMGSDGGGKPQRSKAKAFMEERAPSTAETMRILEEDEDDERRVNNGIGSQTGGEARDATEEAIIGDSPTPQPIKGQYTKASLSDDR